jgi:hypothetical protein
MAMTSSAQVARITNAIMSTPGWERYPEVLCRMIGSYLISAQVLLVTRKTRDERGQPGDSNAMGTVYGDIRIWSLTLPALTPKSSNLSPPGLAWQPLGLNIGCHTHPRLLALYNNHLILGGGHVPLKHIAFWHERGTPTDRIAMVRLDELIQLQSAYTTSTLAVKQCAIEPPTATATAPLEIAVTVPPPLTLPPTTVPPPAPPLSLPTPPPSAPPLSLPTPTTTKVSSNGDQASASASVQASSLSPSMLLAQQNRDYQALRSYCTNECIIGHLPMKPPVNYLSSIMNASTGQLTLINGYANTKGTDLIYNGIGMLHHSIDMNAIIHASDTNTNGNNNNDGKETKVTQSVIDTSSPTPFSTAKASITAASSALPSSSTTTASLSSSPLPSSMVNTTDWMIHPLLPIARLRLDVATIIHPHNGRTYLFGKIQTTRLSCWAITRRR